METLANGKSYSCYMRGRDLGLRILACANGAAGGTLEAK